MTFNLTLEIGPNLKSVLETFAVATSADFNAKLDSIDAKVTAIAAEIADLKARIDTGGMPAADEDAALARLTNLETALSALLPAAPEA